MNLRKQSVASVIGLAIVAGLLSQTASAQFVTAYYPSTAYATTAYYPSATTAYYPTTRSAYYPTATTAYYPKARSAYYPAATTAYYPTTQVYQTYRPYTGWYPGKYLSSWSYRSTAWLSTQTARVASYYPTYSARYRAAYTPYYASYAPATYAVSRPVMVGASYAPASCNSCATHTYRPVVLNPVAASPCCATSCNSCSTVTPISYEVPVQPRCEVAAPAAVAAPPAGYPVNQQPQLAPNENPAASRSTYFPPKTEDHRAPAPAANASEAAGDGSAPAAAGDGASYYQYPAQFNSNDRSASKPTVPVWNAVYRKHITAKAVSQREVHRPTFSKRSKQQAEIDAQAWTSGK